MRRRVPVALPQELTTDGFEWTSDSDDAVGSTLFFSLAGFFVVTEIQLKFPAGDTYKFDLSVSGGDDGTLITVRGEDNALSSRLSSHRGRCCSGVHDGRSICGWCCYLQLSEDKRTSHQ